MDFEVGAILTGKVTGITKFGAFVTIAPGKSGLVHISEIANTYVSDISQHLAQGQEVTVKIMNVDDSGRLNLSIKAAGLLRENALGENVPREKAPHAAPVQNQQQRPGHNSSRRPPEPAGPPTFEDKLKRFMQDSDSKMSGLKQYSDKKGGKRRGR